MQICREERLREPHDLLMGAKGFNSDIRRRLIEFNPSSLAKDIGSAFLKENHKIGQEGNFLK